MFEQYHLSFGQIIRIKANLAEVIVAEGVEMDMTMINEYHNWINQHLTSPCFLLINKVHRYTYTFEAQQQIAGLDKINAIAIISYSKATTVSTRYLDNLPRPRNWQLEIFDNREAALHWLQLHEGFIQPKQ